MGRVSKGNKMIIKTKKGTITFLSVFLVILFHEMTHFAVILLGNLKSTIILTPEVLGFEIIENIDPKTALLLIGAPLITYLILLPIITFFLVKHDVIYNWKTSNISFISLWYLSYEPLYVLFDYFVDPIADYERIFSILNLSKNLMIIFFYLLVFYAMFCYKLFRKYK